jgi:hypothetical protein
MYWPEELREHLGGMSISLLGNELKGCETEARPGVRIVKATLHAHIVGLAGLDPMSQIETWYARKVCLKTLRDSPSPVPQVGTNAGSHTIFIRSINNDA